MKLAVIGAGGWVGSSATFHIAASGLVEEVVMIGSRQNVVEQHALDLQTAVSMLDVRVRWGTYEQLAGSHVVINAAGTPHIQERAEMLSRNITLIKGISLKLKELCPEAIVITATNPVDPLNYATWRLTGPDRRRVLGYSLNDSLRFREFVAAAKGVRVSEVEATVIGEHGSTQVPLFSSVRINGEPVVFSEAEKARIRESRPKSFQRIEALQKETGRTAGWTCAVGMAALVRAIAENTGEVIPCSVVLAGEYGMTGLSMGVPVRLGKTGIQEIVEWELTSDELVDLEHSADCLRAAARSVDEVIDAAKAQA